MAKDIKETLKESAKDLLPEEALNEIQAAFDSAVDEKSTLTTEAALVQQDEDHAEKVSKLLEAIDNDHTKKLQQIVKAITENHTHKLMQVIKKYTGEVHTEATEFKGKMVDDVSNYLDLYLEKTFPQDMLEEAVNNKRAATLLNELQKMLAVDMALAKDSIKDAVVDGKAQINEANEQLATIIHENNGLKEELASAKSEALLEHLSQDLPEVKKNYIKKVLGDKDPEFIAENFNYTIELFDKEADKRGEELKKEAQTQVKGNVDSGVEEVVVENTSPVVEESDPLFNTYMGELGKY
jgi:cation transport regulator ChaB